MDGQTRFGLMLSTIAWEAKSREVIKGGWIFKEFTPADPPTDILPPSFMIINAKLNIADFFNQFNPLLYHCNHFIISTGLKRLSSGRVSSPISTYRSPTHPFSKPPTVKFNSVNYYYFFIVKKTFLSCKNYLTVFKISC